MFTIDTNILIYHAAGDKNAVNFLVSSFEDNVRLFLPSIVVVEFLSYPLITYTEIVIFKSILSYFTLSVLTFSVAQTAATLRRHFKLKLADSVVAATALGTNSILITRNIRDFKKIPQLKLRSV